MPASGRTRSFNPGTKQPLVRNRLAEGVWSATKSVPRLPRSARQSTFEPQREYSFALAHGSAFDARDGLGAPGLQF